MNVAESTYLTLDNAMILTVDSCDRFYANGRIVIRDHVIEEIGPSEQIASRGRTVDMSGRLLMPGLINTHTHSPSVLFRGLKDDTYFRDWLEHYMWPAEKHLNAQRVQAGSRLAYLEFLLNGMTTNVDMWYFGDSVARAASESGLRSLLAVGIFSFPTPQSDHSLEDAEDILERAKGGDLSGDAFGRVVPCIGPHDVYSTTPELLSACEKLASRYNAFVHMHLSETQGDNEEVLRRFGRRPAEIVEAAGLMEHPCLFAHCNHLSDSDREIFARHGAAVSFNPVTNLKLCEGILPIPDLRRRGITVGVGTDGAQSNNSLDLVSDMKTGLIVQKYQVDDPAVLTARDAVRMMTIDGAKAIHMDDRIGSLETGKRADIIGIDMTQPGMTPLLRMDAEHVCSHVVYASRKVTDVLVDGEFLLRDGRCLRVDPEEVKAAAAAGARAIISEMDAEAG